MITSPQNPRIKEVVRLRKRRRRADSGSFIIEGRRETHRALAAGVDVSTVFVEDGVEPPSEGPAEIVEVSARVFGHISGRQSPDGVLAVARTWDLELARIAVDAPGLVLVAVGIEKPGNLGAMLRTADGAGADAVLLADPVCDPFGSNVVRASQGSLFSVVLGSGTTAEVQQWLTTSGIRVFPTSPDAEIAYWQPDYSSGTAFVVGPEDVGLPDTWMSAGTPISIPMSGAADSLNASVTAGIVLYTAVAARAR